MGTALVIIDIQNDYFAGGAYALPGAEEAVVVARATLDAARAAGVPVVHVQHIEEDPEAPFFRAGTPGVEIHELLTPQAGERVVRKAFPNSFLHTELADALAEAGADRLVVAGMMTSMCVDATVREALDRDLPTTVIGDACAAPDLTYGGRTVESASVHAAFLAALGDAGASVVTGAEAPEALRS
jgi:nicotinamidase-related amidase